MKKFLPNVLVAFCTFFLLTFSANAQNRDDKRADENKQSSQLLQSEPKSPIEQYRDKKEDLSKHIVIRKKTFPNVICIPNIL